MKKLLFIGHEYHKKTRSSDFMQNIMAKYFDVEFFALDPYAGNIDEQLSPLKNKAYDVVVLWQMMPSIDKLKKYIKFKHCAFFPMYDGALSRDDPFWYQYRDVNIINFSKTLHDELKALGFSSYYFQFFPKPIDTTNIGDEKSVFFWQRINQININTVGKLIDLKSLHHIHMHHAIDPGHEFVEPPVKINNKITHSTWFDTREDMQKQMQKSAIYIAPRMFEGIGMSFLEAMAMRRCVIAPNYPTMNEYITNGVNGILYDLNNPQPIDLSSVRDIQERTKQYIESGYQKWEQQKWKIIDILTTPPQTKKAALIKKYTNKYDIDNMYTLFGILPLMRVVGNQWHVTYKLFGLIPVILTKKRITSKRVYLCGIPLFKIKQTSIIKPQINVPIRSSEPAELFVQLQQTKNPKGRVLMVFHLNFLRHDRGCSNYTYEIAKMLKDEGFAIDFFSADLFGRAEFDDIKKWNDKEHLIDNFYFSNWKAGLTEQEIKENEFTDINWSNDIVRSYFEKIVMQNKYSAININYIQWAGLVKNRNVLFPGTELVYTCHDTNFNQVLYNNFDKDICSKASAVADAMKYEIQYFDLFDSVMFISFDEMLFWQKFFPNKKFYFFPHPLNEITYDTKKNIDLLYLAAYNPYNLHGLQWFVEQVMPFINKKIKITICGKLVQFLRQNNPDYIHQLENDGFNLIDFADDLDKLYSRVKVVMVPLYEGTGMKIKTIEAMSHNIPIVSRLPGVDGFPDKTNNGILVTNDPQKFADNIMRLLSDKEFYKYVKKQEQKYFKKYFEKRILCDFIKDMFKGKNNEEQ